jgi:hypothetical protein
MFENASSLKPLEQLKLNCPGMIIGRSSTRAILVSDWLMLKKSSPLKLLGQMEPNLAGSIYVRSSINFFILFHSANKHGCCY